LGRGVHIKEVLMSLRFLGELITALMVQLQVC